MIRGVVKDQGARWASTLGIQFDVENIFATQWYDTYMLKFSEQPLATTNRTIAAIGQQGMAEGWSVPKMQKRLTQTFQAWMDGGLAPEDFAWFTERMPPHRTAMIARTESIRASNAGTDRLFQEWGVRQREWYATADDRTRPDHQVGAAWGLEPLVVDQGEAFTIGGARLMYPGDPSAPPAQTVQCRCTLLPVIAEGEVVGEAVQEPDPVLAGPPKFKTVAEAEQWVMDQGLAEFASFKGFDVKVANAIVESLDDMRQFRPGLKLKSVGNNRALNARLRDQARARVEQAADQYAQGLNWDAERRQRWVSGQLRKLGVKMSARSYAEAYSDGSFYVSYKYAKDAETFAQKLANDVESGWHPAGCGSIRSVADHELAHVATWKLPTGHKDELFNMYRDAARADVMPSRYAARNLDEFIAESWAEYRNSPTPRATAQKVGDYMVQMLKEIP